MLAVERPDVTGVFNIAGPLLLAPADATELWLDAAEQRRSRQLDTFVGRPDPNCGGLHAGRRHWLRSCATR